MGGNEKGHQLKGLWGVRLLMPLFWSATLLVSFFLQTSHFGQRAEEMAQMEGLSAARKDQSLRRWLTDHGGVYVRSDGLSPNPYLKGGEKELFLEDGTGLVWMNPAYVLRESMARYGESQGVLGRITALTVINPKNAPDKWETSVFAKGAVSNGTVVTELDQMPLGEHMRVMLPTMTENGCLKCHDNGYFAEGRFDSAISVAVPMSAYRIYERAETRSAALRHLLVWAVGMSMLLLFFHSVGRSSKRLAELAASLEVADTVYSNTIDGIVVFDESMLIVSVNRAFSEITGYSETEVSGREWGFLKSSEHGDFFHSEMEYAMTAYGVWSGEIWLVKKQGDLFLARMTVSHVQSKKGAGLRTVMVISDVTQARRQDDRMRHMALHDALTGLANRSLMDDRLTHALDKAARDSSKAAVMVVDLDCFKSTNDDHGHAVGDAVLCEVAKRMGAHVRRSDTVARTGGDEFAVILENVSSKEEALEVGCKMVDALSEPFSHEGLTIRMGASVGVAVYPDDGSDKRALFKAADDALYKVKENGRNGCL